jgi:hypothetical protein
MDEYRWGYYKEIGYDEELAKHKRQTEGFWGVYQYWKPFEAYAVERYYQSIKTVSLILERVILYMKTALYFKEFSTF